MLKPYLLLILGVLGTLVNASLNISALPSECTPGVMSTPTYGTTNGVFTACSSIIITASASRVYQILIDFEKYPQWNSFVIYVNKTTPGPYALGTHMVFTTSGLFPFGANTTSNEIISGLYPAKGQTTAIWKFDSPTPGFIDAEHVSRIIDLGGGKAKYLSYESYYGLGSNLIDALEGSQLSKQFKVQGQNLKKRAESKAAT